MDDSDLDGRLIDAAAALAAQDHVRALAILDQLAAQWPDAPAVRAMRSEALLAGGDAAASLEEAGRLIELRGEDTEGLLLFARAAWRAEKLSLAQRSYEKALRFSRRDAALLAEYAWFMAQARGPRLAEAAARDALDANPDSPTAWAALGVAQHRQHRPDEAEASLRRALALDPHDVNTQAALVQVFQDRRQDAKALALASLMAEQGEAPEFVAAVEQEAKDRQVARMLVERNVPLGPRAAAPRQWPVWIAVVCIVAVLLGAIMLPTLWAAAVVGVVGSLVALWIIRRVVE